MIAAYIAGPFSALTREEVEENIRRAVMVGIEVAKLGVYPITPHANTAHPAFEALQPYDFWIDGCKILLQAAHVMVLVPGWEQSSGACGERKIMIQLGRPVFESVEALKQWLSTRGGQ